MQATLKNLPATYRDALRFLGNRDERGCGNNTRLRKVRDIDGRVTAVAIRLHSTDVITLTADGRIVTDTGGYETVTTKDRINRVLRVHGYRVWSKDWTWYADSWLCGRAVDGRLGPVPYYRGMTFRADFV